VELTVLLLRPSRNRKHYNLFEEELFRRHQLKGGQDGRKLIQCTSTRKSEADINLNSQSATSVAVTLTHVGMVTVVPHGAVKNLKISNRALPYVGTVQSIRCLN
jgi:hypothetical protein